MGRASNAGGSLAATSFVVSGRAPVDAGIVLRLRAKGLGVQNISLQTGYSMEDVRRILAPTGANDNVVTDRPPPFPRDNFDWTEHADKILRVTYGELGVEAAAVAKVIGCTLPSLRARAHKLGVKRGQAR